MLNRSISAIHSKLKKTNWCVITGAPSSGKTTIINALSVRGFQTAPEIARAYLKQLLNEDPEAFDNYRGKYIVQNKILELKMARENQLPSDALIFFDRGIPDSLAYYRYYQLETDQVMEKMRLYQYAYVFYLEGLPVIYDEIRHEDEVEARKIGEHIYQAYRDLGYQVIRIPPAPVEQRITLILSSISTSCLNQK
ncbi:AAA family ATPase [Legionella yabuuchiae]|uniref:AAA family ATPase n=1 Tax=Legionella yabuuchiae TaxID=376727 RepID=UPI0013EF5D7E|nr:ATP-binding protein [Legionella yabuuchiae]